MTRSSTVIGSAFFAAWGLSLCFHVNQSLASIQQYTDRAAFEAALWESTTFDFDSLTDGTVFAPSVSFGAATVAPTTGPNLTAVGTGDFGAPTGQLGALNGGGIRVELNPGFKALGMDIGVALDNAANLSFTLLDTAGDSLTGLLRVTNNEFLGTAQTTFFGFISDSADISSLEFGSGMHSEIIDNLTFGNPTPEPSSLLLWGALVGCAALRRRRS